MDISKAEQRVLHLLAQGGHVNFGEFMRSQLETR
jgi:uncharacterized protein YjhX (UPF0386 family)